MSLLYRNDNLPEDQPQTHALVIGVGKYTHLDNVSHLRLGQLTSPIASAKAFARWLTGQLKNPEAPLGSVDLLLSSQAKADSSYARTDGSTAPLRAATFQNIADAFSAWSTRCDKPGNVAVFYFCGHGLEKEDLALLPEDFGRFDANPWTTAINFNKTLTGMKTTCSAAIQCYFVDTCRQVDSQTLETSDFGGVSLRQNDITGLHNSPTVLALLATEVGRTAFGLQNAPSHFTSTLLRTLAGGGASKQGGKWVIDLQNLANGVNTLMKLVNAEARTTQMTSPRLEGPNYRSIIHHVSEKPVVAARISCLPLKALATANLQLTGRTQRYSRRPAREPWQIDVEAGVYDLKATFEQGEFATAEFAEEFIIPPYYDRAVEVMT